MTFLPLLGVKLKKLRLHDIPNSLLWEGRLGCKAQLEDLVIGLLGFTAQPTRALSLAYLIRGILITQTTY